MAGLRRRHGRRSRCGARVPGNPEIQALISHFRGVAQNGSPEEAFAAFYAYESQVPRVAKEKARGLQEMYGADQKTYGYFTFHTTADVHHSNVWREQLSEHLEANPEMAERALASAEAAAKALWTALDGIEAQSSGHEPLPKEHKFTTEGKSTQSNR